MLRIENLQKSYRSHPVFRGLTLDLGPGCYALCDEESTGKSTLLNIVAGRLAPDGGDVFINGHSITRQHKQVNALRAWVPADCLSEPVLTGQELLQRTAAEKGVDIGPDVFEWIRQLDLEPHLEKQFEQMSTGMRRKVYLAAAAIGDPAVILADGPSDGLDAGACRALAAKFKAWGKNRVVLFATFDPELVQASGAKILSLQG
ncbi:ABC transporter ATP-binding protein [Neopusillimonas aromaticivorans]|uniref:ABC transporter ATP-binding protein n=1 Tax=Neopusillimonas aromaticivorans TaxID=2979868 RepID=UPI00259282EA|nr:ATP-binding cassette domain-containing protein [Neopusillimonas aromaticivorans]WJJ93595.1 ATP-binding cassette domain-containing protein [Neopusillimonas aromaticivorans]